MQQSLRIAKNALVIVNEWYRKNIKKNLPEVKLSIYPQELLGQIDPIILQHVAMMTGSLYDSVYDGSLVPFVPSVSWKLIRNKIVELPSDTIFILPGFKKLIRQSRYIDIESLIAHEYFHVLHQKFFKKEYKLVSEALAIYAQLVYKIDRSKYYFSDENKFREYYKKIFTCRKSEIPNTLRRELEIEEKALDICVRGLLKLSSSSDINERLHLGLKKALSERFVFTLEKRILQS